MSTVVCPSCGRENPAGFQFCGFCTAPLGAAEPSREERKVVTMLFCDLVGFTQRSEHLDPEDVRALLRGYHEHLRRELERFGGTVEKFIGDAVVAVFGAPIAHEDDPERAVRAALAIRDWARDEEGLQLRIAVNTGEALVTLGARPERGEGMVAGDVVNTAARLQSAAPVNGILVGETTYRATRDAIDYADADPVEAKGKSERLPVWEALEARAHLGVDLARRGRAPLVGRARELDVLRDALARARGGEPQLVTLVGVPGIGKSRLVAELFQVVEQDPELITWRQGRSLPYGEGVSFWALGEMVKAQAGVLETDPTAEVEQKLDAAVAAAEVDEADWVAGHLRALVGLGGDADPGGDRRSEAFAAWRRFFEALAEQGPIVLVFEDLHWADDGLLDFVDHLVDWVGGAPLLVVATARPELLERRPGWGGGKRNATTISLSPLTDEDTSRLIGSLLDRPVLPAETQTALLQRAGGNPLYAEEYVRMLAERGAEVGLPETVQGIVAARLDALPSDEKAIVQDASVLGKVFWLGGVAAMDGDSRWQLEEQLHRLERKEFVRRERRSSVAGESEYAFLHVLVRDVAYSQIPRSERVDKHRRAAAWIDSLGRPEDTAEMRAHHYESALEYARATGQPVDDIAERACIAFRDAGDRAAALTVTDAAARFYERALELWPREDPDRPELLLALARACFATDTAGNLGRLEQIRTELLETASAEVAAEAAAFVSIAEWHTGNRERSFALMREAVARLVDAPPSRSQATVFAELARLLILGGVGGDEGPELARRAISVAQQLGMLDVEARALNTLAIHRVTTGDVSGLADLERSLALAEEARSPDDIHRAYVNLNALTFTLGDLRRSREYLMAGLEAADRYGVETGARWLRGSRVELEFQAGDWDEALRRADEFLAEVEAGSPHYLEHPVRATRSAMRAARGDVEGALADDVRATELAHALEDPQVLHQGLCGSAWTRVMIGDLATAATRVNEVLALVRGNVIESALVWADLAFALVALGRGPEVLELADLDPRPSRWKDAARAFAAGDMTLAADTFEEIGSLYAEAYARLRAAEQLVSDGRRTEADAHLQQALAFYRRVGATKYVREGEALLAESA